MAYLVLARKYRPQQFGEMSGQAHVVRTLSNALKTGQLAHAFLFTGPRGVGKTTTARLVAKALNCEQGPTAAPCGVCTACTEITEGRAVDVVEIDAASNNGVDNVRDIVEAVKYRPARDRYKIFIVDEVHMLSTGAFNALLKTLEEPPEHVKFVLATTDVHKVPETIVSRCQRFDFRRLTLPQIADQLGKVAEAEGMRLSPAALALVARQAEGGMRDALSMLDQVRASCGDTASDEAVAEALGAVDAAAISRIGAALVGRDGAALLAEVDQLHGRGLEMKRVAEEIVRHLRNVLVAKLVPAMAIDLPDAELAEVKAQAAGADAAQLTRLFDLAQRAVVDVRQAEGSRHALEVALLEGIFLAPGAQVSELIARVEALAAGAPLPPPAPRPPTSGGGGPAPGRGTQAGGTQAGGTQAGGTQAGGAGRGVASFGSPGCAAGTTPESVRPERSEDASASERSRRAATAAPESVRPERSEDASASERSRRAATETPAPPPPTTRTFASDAERWRAVVEEVEKASPMVAPALKQAALLGMKEGEVAIQLVPGIFAQTAERRRAEIEGVLSRFLGRPTRLVVTVGAAPPPGDAAAGASTPTPAPSIAQVEAAERQARTARVREAARTNPNIRDAARILEGGVEGIEEL